jgi:hypothetical protein
MGGPVVAIAAVRSECACEDCEQGEDCEEHKTFHLAPLLPYERVCRTTDERRLSRDAQTE